MRPGLLLALLVAYLATGAASAKEGGGDARPASNIGIDWFDGSACSAEKSAEFYFRLGGQTFRAPRSTIIQGGLKTTEAPTPDELRQQKTGCESNPIEFTTVQLRSDVAQTTSITLLETDATKAAKDIWSFIQERQKASACKKTTMKDIMFCQGEGQTLEGMTGTTLLILAAAEDGSVKGSSAGMPPRAETTREVSSRA